MNPTPITPQQVADRYSLHLSTAHRFLNNCSVKPHLEVPRGSNGRTTKIYLDSQWHLLDEAHAQAKNLEFERRSRAATERWARLMERERGLPALNAAVHSADDPAPAPAPAPAMIDMAREFNRLAEANASLIEEVRRIKAILVHNGFAEPSEQTAPNQA